MNYTATDVRFYGDVVAYRPSDYFANLWFVVTLDAAGKRDQFLGQVEWADGVYYAYEYPTPEAAVEGAQDVQVGDESTLADAVACFAAEASADDVYGDAADSVDPDDVRDLALDRELGVY